MAQQGGADKGGQNDDANGRAETDTAADLDKQDDFYNRNADKDGEKDGYEYIGIHSTTLDEARTSKQRLR